MKPAIPDGKVQPVTYVAALHPSTIDKGVSRNNNFDEHFVERMATKTKVCKIPVI